MTSTDDKIQFKVYISANVVERFKRMISIKYPAYKQGLMSREVEKAMTRHIGIFNTHAQSTQIPIDKDYPVHQVHRLKEDIKQYLVKSGRYEEEPRFVPNKLLEEAIGALRGLDNRTLRKWKYIWLLKLNWSQSMGNTIIQKYYNTDADCEVKHDLGIRRHFQFAHCSSISVCKDSSV